MSFGTIRYNSPPDDREVIGFPERHLHVDGRFVTPKLWQRLIRSGLSNFRDHPLFGKVHPGWAMVLNRPLLLSWRMNHPVKDPQIEDLGTRSLVMRRHLPRSLEEIYRNTPWMLWLEEEYEGSHLKGMTCPHRGADLSGIKPDEKGHCICPLHGLRFNLHTGELARRRPSDFGPHVNVPSKSDLRRVVEFTAKMNARAHG